MKREHSREVGEDGCLLVHTKCRVECQGAHVQKVGDTLTGSRLPVTPQPLTRAIRHKLNSVKSASMGG
jgi:hypothetical protein